MPANQFRAHFPPPHPLFWTLNTPAIFFPNHLGSGTRQQRTAPMPQSPWKNPNQSSACLPCLSRSCAWNHNEAYGLTCLFFLRICEDKLPRWQSFPCLHVSPYQIKTNPGCVLKQSHSETWGWGGGGGNGGKCQHTLWGDEIQPIRGKSLFADILFASHCGQDTVTRPLQVSDEHTVSAVCQGTSWTGCSSCQPEERQKLQPPWKPHPTREVEKFRIGKRERFSFPLKGGKTCLISLKMLNWWDITCFDF